MRVVRTPEFDDERDRFAFRFSCEDCGHFDQAKGRCRHEWPNELHRQGPLGEWVDFCKEFELC